MVLGLGNSIISGAALESGYVATASWDVDGTDDAVNIPSHADIKPTTTDTSAGVGITVSAWVKTTWQTNAASRMFVGGYEYPGGWYLDFAGTRARGILRTSAGAHTVQSAWRTFSDANGDEGTSTHFRSSGWHHISMTFDGRVLRLYIDGEHNYDDYNTGSDDTAIAYGTGRDYVDVFIGANPGDLTSSDGGGTFDPGTSPNNGAVWDGLINEVAIWNKALDTAALEEIYQAVNTDGAVLDLTKDSGDYDYSDDLLGLWRASEIDGTTAVNANNPGTHDGTHMNSIGTSSEVPS